MVGGYATRAWGIEIDQVKCDKGNAFMRYAAADMAKRRAEWGAFDVPTIRCAPIEEACCSPLPRCGCSNVFLAYLCFRKLACASQAGPSIYKYAQASGCHAGVCGCCVLAPCAGKEPGHWVLCVSVWLRAQVKSLDTWTDAYSFWEGVPVASRRAFARLFRASTTLQVMLSH